MPDGVLQRRWRGPQSAILLDTTRERDVEGAIRSGKTTVCLWAELTAGLSDPGVIGFLARWSKDALDGILKPAWRAICEEAGVVVDWNAAEEYDELPNGSKFYLRSLKTQDQISRYSRFRGLTLGRVYVDQAEELPKDVYLELAGRLSQPGHRQQITISPNAVDDDHWIAKEFPEHLNSPHRKYFQLSIYDNARHLGPEVIPALERLYPPTHPKHLTMIQGRRGMNVQGEPVYGGAYVPAIHERPCAFDPSLPLDEAIDFGKHHPCVVWRQRTRLGQVRYLGGILGQNMYLEDFLPLVLQYRGEWFRGLRDVRTCCDPAGTSDTSHGLRETALRVLQAHGFTPTWRPNSNAPDVRLGMVERTAAQMRKRTASGEMFGVDNGDHWLRLSAEAVVADRFLAKGFEAGYVWDVHMVSVGSKQIRKPKKDGWFEHGQNCSEYLELNFGTVTVEKPSPKPAPYHPRSVWS
jgi:hypothetical protein